MMDMISHDIPIHGVIVRMSCQTARNGDPLQSMGSLGTLEALWLTSGFKRFEMLQWGSRNFVAPVEFWPTVLARYGHA